jgi:integrase
MWYGKQGKQVIKYKTVDLSHIKAKKQQEEAEKQYILFKDEIEKGIYLDAGKMTFEDFTLKWLKDYAEPTLAPKTLFSYEDILFKRILPSLGHIKLNRLQPQHLMEFYNNLREDGIRKDTKYKPKDNFMEQLEDKCITLKDFATSVGLTTWTVKNLKIGNNIATEIADKISEASGININTLFDSAGKPGGLSERSILYHHRIISSILTSAVQWQFILNNPAERVKPPKIEKKEAVHFDITQTEYLFKLVDQEPIKYRAALYLSLCGGMRAGELNALEWPDIDWEKNSISISKASQYLPGKGTFTKDPKNSSSERIISLPPAAMSVLREYQLWQNGTRSGMENLWVDTNRIFTQVNGEAIFPQTISKWFSKFIMNHNESVMTDEKIPQDEKTDYLLDRVTLHGLRHTSATLLIGQKVDIATVSKRLVHADISTTLNIYTHALKELDQTAADKLETMLTKDVKKDLKQG